jgi:prevent-host-death family protein
MIAMTSVEAQNRFGELIDRSQREPVQVTRRGRPVAYVVSEHDMQALSDLQQRRAAAARWYSQYRQNLIGGGTQADASSLSDEDVNRLVHELR